ncbi:hypothetical protein [Roseovarius sp. D22-M7]|uniref:hypothetical protein n=1 Tax=Roseovarius sp. D22-M7 TaxID=3127116 RepID=UPI00300FD652
MPEQDPNSPDDRGNRAADIDQQMSETLQKLQESSVDEKLPQSLRDPLEYLKARNSDDDRCAPAIAEIRDDLVGLVPELLAFALSQARNSSVADDLLQEILLKAMAKVDSFTPDTKCTSDGSRSGATPSGRELARCSARWPRRTPPRRRGCRRTPRMTGGSRCAISPRPSPYLPTSSEKCTS